MADQALITTEQKPVIARVLLDTNLPQLDHLFDYEVPENLLSEVKVGHRVKVPFRSRQRDVLGYVIELVDESSFTGQLAMISEIVSTIQLLDQDVWKLARAVADRAGGSAGDILRLAIPPRQVRAEKSFLAARAKELEAASKETADDPPAQNHTAATETIVATETTVAPETLEIAQQLQSAARFHLLVQGAPERLPTGEWVMSWAKHFSELAISISNLGKSVIIIVPDFRDIDQIQDTLIALGQTSFVRLDTRQSVGDRYKQFLRTLEGGPSIILGNRSAVYAPAANLGAILVWDEADESLSEPLAPYVHARDAALVRSSMQNTGLLFGSHTRSTQMQRLIDLKYVRPVSTGSGRPRVIHTGALTRQEEQTGRIPQIAAKVMRDGLAKGPVLVQVASPGFAPVMVCKECHDLALCIRCKGPLMSSLKGGVSCRVCADASRSWQCETCRSTVMQPRGAGTERTAEQFAAMFGETNIIVSDGAHRRVRVDARPALVVATRGAEPIAAGGYRAVVVLDVDRMIGSWHLHAGEDALRWWRGAAALAAPDADFVLAGGGGPVVQAFVKGADEAWARSELADRVELRFPPAVRVATVSGIKNVVDDAIKTIVNIDGVDVLGPSATSDDEVRAVVRFDYSRGAEVATKLRAELLSVVAAGTAKKHVHAKSQNRASSSKIVMRLRFDDETVFDERGEE